VGEKIIIYGASGFGREVAWLVQVCEDDKYVACFIDDDVKKHGTLLNEVPILSLEQALRQHPDGKIVGGVGGPRLRQTLMMRAASHGFNFGTMIHPKVEMSRWVEIGVGSVICVGSILTTNIVLGEHVQINLGCTIGHDVVMGDYATLAPGVHISGCVHIGQRAYIGTGAVVINGTKDHPIVIGDDAVVGAGACVVDSVMPGATVVGVPARALKE
jgi:sugar O-acyltransferase (sialic acid O-acetyltransferase NeuD family)